MTPHKVCPTCGQPAVLEMPVCRRCGYAYPDSRNLTARPLSALSQRELAQSNPTAGRGSRAGAAFALAIILLLIAGGAAVMLRSVARHAPLRSRFADSNGRTPSRPNGPDLMSGLFTERVGAKEMPLLLVRNEDFDMMHLMLKDSSGRLYHLAAPPGETARIEVPAGHYDIAVTSDNPAIHPNQGDALFRAYKEYSTTFVTSQYDAPIHLGD